MAVAWPIPAGAAAASPRIRPGQGLRRNQVRIPDLDLVQGPAPVHILALAPGPVHTPAPAPVLARVRIRPARPRVPARIRIPRRLRRRTGTTRSGTPPRSPRGWQ